MSLRTFHPKVLAAAALVAMALESNDAAAAPDKQACTEAYTTGQEHRLENRLVRAHEALLTCAQPACPAFMQAECTRWLAEIDAAQPTIVIEAHDAAGNDVRAVQLRIDGEVSAQSLDGRAIAVDPGERLLSLTTPAGVVEQHLVVREGEKRRRVVFTLPAAEPRASAEHVKPAQQSSTPSPSSHERRAIPTAGWILAGVGALALGSFAYFAASGVSRQSDLRSQCAPTCPESDLSSLRRTYLFADISLGVALLAGAGFAWTVIARGGPDPQVAVVHRF